MTNLPVACLGEFFGETSQPIEVATFVQAFRKDLNQMSSVFGQVNVRIVVRFDSTLGILAIGFGSIDL